MPYLYYYRDKDAKGINLVLEQGGVRNPIEIKKTNAGVLDTLLERIRIFRYTHKHLYLFSKSGFTAVCEYRAKELGYVSLVDDQDMQEVLLRD